MPTTVHTSAEWRLVYFREHQAPVPAASLLGDILADMAELEATIRSLESVLIAHKLLTDND